MQMDTSTNEFDLSHWPFYWLVLTNGHYIRLLENELKKIDLDIPNWRVLMLLQGQEARSVSYLANASVTKRSTMTRIIIRMKKDGLVNVRQRKNDARVTEAYLTQKGDAARAQAWTKANAIFALAFRGISQESTDELIKTLSQIVSNLDT